MQDITVEELKAKMDRGDNFLFIDVREQHEYDMYNLNAQLIPLGTLPQHIDELEDHKEDEIIIHCRSGMRSATAKAMLEQVGFTKVRNLLGGVLDWIAKYETK